MNILSEVTAILKPLLPIETGVFSGIPPDKYAVLTPLADTFEGYADNKPHYETQELRISIFDRGSYIKLKNKIVNALLNADFTITDRRYIAREVETGFHHYGIDVAKIYKLEE